MRGSVLSSLELRPPYLAIPWLSDRAILLVTVVSGSAIAWGVGLASLTSGPGRLAAGALLGRALVSRVAPPRGRPAVAPAPPPPPPPAPRPLPPGGRAPAPPAPIVGDEGPAPTHRPPRAREPLALATTAPAGAHVPRTPFVLVFGALCFAY